MGRFSPTVLPEYHDPQLGAHLADAFETYQRMKQGAQEAEDIHNARGTEEIRRGVRNGTAPDAPGGTFQNVTNWQPGVVPQAQLPQLPGRQLGDAMKIAGAPSGENPIASVTGRVGDQLTAAYAGQPAAPAPSVTDMPSSPSALLQPGATLASAMHPASALTDERVLHPGAFDPISGSFATAHGLPANVKMPTQPPMQSPPAPPPGSLLSTAMGAGGRDRYVQRDPGHYIDLEGDVGLERARAVAEGRYEGVLAGVKGRQDVAAGHDEARKYAVDHPRPSTFNRSQQISSRIHDLTTDGGLELDDAVQQARAEFGLPPIETHADKRDYDVAHPLPTRPGKMADPGVRSSLERNRARIATQGQLTTDTKELATYNDPKVSGVTIPKTTPLTPAQTSDSTAAAGRVGVDRNALRRLTGAAQQAAGVDGASPPADDRASKMSAELVAAGQRRDALLAKKVDAKKVADAYAQTVQQIKSKYGGTQ